MRGTGIKGAGAGVKGAGDGGRGGGGRGIFWGGGFTKMCCILPILLFFMYFNAKTGYQKYLIDVLK